MVSLSWDSEIFVVPKTSSVFLLLLLFRKASDFLEVKLSQRKFEIIRFELQATQREKANNVCKMKLILLSIIQ